MLVLDKSNLKHVLRTSNSPHTVNHCKILAANNIALEINVAIYHTLLRIYPGDFLQGL